MRWSRRLGWKDCCLQVLAEGVWLGMTMLTCVVAGWERLLLVMLMVRGKIRLRCLKVKESVAKERTPEELMEKSFLLLPLVME